jgi:hypothetical protein
VAQAMILAPAAALAQLRAEITPLKALSKSEPSG